MRVFAIQRLALMVGIMALVVSGCQNENRQHVADPMTRIARLTKKATATHVHRFRKPHRDEQVRMRRELAVECERMVRDIQVGGPAAEALTGIAVENQEDQMAKIALLASALRQLSDAAQHGNSHSIRRSYQKVRSAQASLRRE